MPEGYRPFLHFCDEEGEILFQASHVSDPFQQETTGRFSVKAIGSIPAEVTPGQEVELVYGIYSPKSGGRLRLAGPDAGDQRIRAGQLVIEGDADEVSGVGWKPHVPPPDRYLARWNVDGKPVDFGAVKTSGGCRLHAEGKSLIITPLPGERVPAFEVEIAWDKLVWELPMPTRVEAMGEDGGVMSIEPISAADGVVSVECRPGVFAYRLGTQAE